MEVKRILKEYCNDNKIAEAIKLFQKISNDNKSINYSIELLSELKENSHNQRIGIISQEQFGIKKNSILRSFLELLDDLQSDLEILKNKIQILLFDYEAITDVIELLLSICVQEFVDTISQIKMEFVRKQENFENISDIELTNESSNYWIAFEKNAFDKIKQIGSILETNYLKPGWELVFLNYLNENHKQYFPRPKNKVLNNLELRYYQDIVKIPDYKKGKLIKGQLYNWLENYIVENYEKALEILINLRDVFGVKDSKYYEYLLITYLKNFGTDKFVKTHVLSNKTSETNRLIFYVRRIYEDGPFTFFQQETLKVFLDEILVNVSKIYHNITYNHLLEDKYPGRSKRREVIKRCFDFTCLVLENFQLRGSLEFDTNILIDLITEVEGGGKFKWIELKNDKIENSTFYDANSMRKKLIQILKESKITDGKLFLKENLIKNLKKTGHELQKRRNLEESFKKAFIKECIIGWFIYNDQEFKNISIDFNQKRNMVFEKKELMPNESTEANVYSYENFMESIGVQTINPFIIDIDLIKNISGILRVLEFRSYYCQEKSNYSFTEKITLCDSKPRVSYLEPEPLLSITNMPPFQVPKLDFFSKSIILLLCVLSVGFICNGFQKHFFEFDFAFFLVLIIGGLSIFVSLVFNE